MAGKEDPGRTKGAEYRLSGEPGPTDAWAAGLDVGLPSALALSEEQWLQISRELVDQQITANQLQGQHEEEMFELKREFLRLESRVLQLEHHREDGSLARVEPGFPRSEAQPKNSRAQVTTHPQADRGWAQQPLLCPKPQGEEPWAVETQAAALGQQLQEARKAARAAGQRVAAQAMVLKACQGQLRQAEAENSRLQLHVKLLSEECALRLQSCARKAAEISGGAGQDPEAAALRAFLESALGDIQAAHRIREQQLAQAAQAYRKRLAELSRRHQELLAMHSLQPGLEGSDVATTATADLEPLLLATKLQQRQEEQKGPGEASLRTAEPRGLDAASWAYIHQKLQDFSHSTQAELERERAQLLVRATTAEGQLSELQEYVDQHLGRYKLEILRLRALLGAREPQEEEASPPGKSH